MGNRHLIGLLLATEEDWPSAFEAVLGRLGPVRYRGETHELTTERITNEPFDLRYTPSSSSSSTGSRGGTTSLASG